MNADTNRRFTVRPEARAEVEETRGMWIANGVLALVDQRRKVYAPIGCDLQGKPVIFYDEATTLWDDQVFEELR